MFKFRSKKETTFMICCYTDRNCVKGMKTLYEYCITHDDELGKKVILIEEEGDMARRILTDELDNTFITPIDREDLYKLSSELDEVLDYAKTSVDEIRVFNLTPDENMIELTGALLDMTEHMVLAISTHGKNTNLICQDEAIYV